MGGRGGDAPPTGEGRRGQDARPRLRLNDDNPKRRGIYARPEGRGAEWHAKREDHHAGCGQMQIICAAATDSTRSQKVWVSVVAGHFASSTEEP